MEFEMNEEFVENQINCSNESIVETKQEFNVDLRQDFDKLRKEYKNLSIFYSLIENKLDSILKTINEKETHFERDLSFAQIEELINYLLEESVNQSIDEQLVTKLVKKISLLLMPKKYFYSKIDSKYYKEIQLKVFEFIYKLSEDLSSENNLNNYELQERRKTVLSTLLYSSYLNDFSFKLLNFILYKIIDFAINVSNERHVFDAKEFENVYYFLAAFEDILKNWSNSQEFWDQFKRKSGQNFVSRFICYKNSLVIERITEKYKKLIESIDEFIVKVLETDSLNRFCVYKSFVEKLKKELKNQYNLISKQTFTKT